MVMGSGEHAQILLVLQRLHRQQPWQAKVLLRISMNYIQPMVPHNETVKQRTRRDLR